MNIFQDEHNYFNPYLAVQTNTNQQPKLFDPQEAFMLGNLFKDLYMTYRGFSNYCLQPISQREKALLEVQMYGFVAHEINLYLDIYPNNQRMLEIYHHYSKKAKEATEHFEKEYGPLTVQESSTKTPFEWVQGPWPWEYQN